MTADEAIGAVAASVAGGVAAWSLAPLAIARAPARLVRVNFRGRRLPAVLGAPLALGALVPLGALVAAQAAFATTIVDPGVAAAVAVLAVGLGVAGYVDDRRGDERERGFRGHLAAAARGRLTGGVVKLGTGALGGLIAARLAGADDLWNVAVIAAVVALCANLVNLLDRAPGRASKAALGLTVAAVAVAPGAWVVAAAGLVGAAVATTTPDLRERAMLGDAGANPLGAVVGLGLALGLGSTARVAVAIALLALNAASERVSFSRVIERTPWLAAVDRWGRG